MNQMESMLHMSLTDRAQGTEGMRAQAVQAQFHEAGQLLMQVSRPLARRVSTQIGVTGTVAPSGDGPRRMATDSLGELHAAIRHAHL